MRPARIALCGFWLLAGIACQLSARADDQSLEEIVVTGTRIARPNFEAASPIVAVPRCGIRAYGVGHRRDDAESISAVRAELHRHVQQCAGSLNSDSEGRAGPQPARARRRTRTLTLVDGRRLMPVNGNGETDLNVIPPALIESVEIVTGGRSAVYGSDAIAGVVNFRLRREFDGVELGGRWGQTDRGDGEEYDVSLTRRHRISRMAADRSSGYVGVLRSRPDQSAGARIFAGPAVLRRARQAA